LGGSFALRGRAPEEGAPRPKKAGRKWQILLKGVKTREKFPFFKKIARQEARAARAKKNSRLFF
jgi:hypothetical protein